MALTIEELEKIRAALVGALLHDMSHADDAIADDAIKIVTREIHQMEQDQLLSESKANPT